jgi:hypothetical protein
MTEAEEQELGLAGDYLRYWKPQLRLDHVDFEIVFKNPGEAKGILATCEIAFSRHRQKIELRHPTERTERDKTDFRRDLEVVVVHELLHTKEMLWRDHPAIDKVFVEDKWLGELHEDSLDAIAEALVRTRRGMNR